MELGADQELIAALRTRGGEVWGAIGLYREPDEPLFDRDEIAFVRSVSPLLAEGARRALLVGEATDPEESESPGLVVLDERLSVESTTPGVERWLADLPGGAWERRVLPPAITAVAARALATLDDPSGAAELAVARVRARSGDVGRAPRRGDGRGQRSAHRGHRRARPRCPRVHPAHVRLRVDRT
jgi:hypothetical protein